MHWPQSNRRWSEGRGRRTRAQGHMRCGHKRVSGVATSAAGTRRLVAQSTTGYEGERKVIELGV